MHVNFSPAGGTVTVDLTATNALLTAIRDDQRIRPPFDWLAEVMADRAFFGKASHALEIGLFTYVELWNPVGSGMNLFVYYVVSALPVNGIIIAREYPAPLTDISGSAFNVQLAGATVPVAELRGHPEVGGSDGPFQVDCLANTPVRIGPKWPAMIGPGDGFAVSSLTAGIAQRATFYWVERPV